MDPSKIIAALMAAAAVGAAHAGTTFSEGFDDVASLEAHGWEMWI